VQTEDGEAEAPPPPPLDPTLEEAIYGALPKPEGGEGGWVHFNPDPRQRRERCLGSINTCLEALGEASITREELRRGLHDYGHERLWYLNDTVSHTTGECDSGPTGSHALCLSRAVGQAHPASPEGTIRQWAVEAQRLYERSVAAQRLYDGSVAGSSPPGSPRQDLLVATEDRTEIELFEAYCKKLVLPDTPLGLQDLHVLVRLRRVVCVLVAPDLRTSSPTTHVYRLVGRGDTAVRLQELWVADFGGNPAKPPKYDALQYRQVSHLRPDSTGIPRLTAPGPGPQVTCTAST
jgi:hypothetical protein